LFDQNKQTIKQAGCHTNNNNNNNNNKINIILQMLDGTKN